jgi:hypothetical protein
MIPINQKGKKETYEFINLTLWWFKIPEVISTIVAIVCGIGSLLGGLPIGFFFCGFWMRIMMVPLRLIFVNWKRNLEKEIPSLSRQKFSGWDVYKTLELSYLRFEKWASDGLDRVFEVFRK